MANKTWVGGTSTAWALAGNWNPAVAPGPTDDIIITAAGTNAPNLSTSTTVNSLSFTGTKTLTLATGAVLNVTGVVPSTTFGVNFTGTTDVITGVGTISATNGIHVATGGSATITATGGTLTVTGVLSEAGTGTLALSVASSGSVLALTSTGSSVTSVTLTGTTRTLQLGANATLAVANAITLSGSGHTITLGGPNSALTDLAGITFSSTGTISGAGTVTGVVTAAANAAHITANGGTLIMASQVTGSALLLTDTAATDTLQFNAAGNTAATLTLNNGTLKLNGATAALTVTNAIAVGTGTVNLTTAGATLTDAAGLTLAGGSITGLGSVAANTNISGFGTVAIPISTAGSITASGGTLDLTGAVTGRTLTVNTTAGSDLKIDGTSTAAPLTINNANQTLEVGAAGALTISAAQNVTLGTIKLDGGTLTDSTGVTFGTTTSNGTLGGSGTVAANLSRSGTGAADTITASGGTLDLTGTFGSGLVAAISSASASDLKFDNTATSSAAISVTSANQTLEVGAAGNLTIIGAQNVTLGTIKLDGGTLTDSTGVTFGTTTSNGTLGGSGTVAANLSRSGTGAADTITASGGTLDLTGTFGSGLVAAISSASASDLKFDNTATSSAAISVTSANQTLEVGAAGNLTIAQAETITAGQAQLDGGTLTDSSGIVVTSTGQIIGAGTVSGVLTGGGNVIAHGGTLDLLSNLGASGPTGQIDLSSTLRVDGTVADGRTFNFFGASGDLLYTNSSTKFGSQFIEHLNVGSSATTPTNFVDLHGTLNVSGSNQGSGTGTNNFTLNDGSVLELSNQTGSGSGGNWFVDWKSDGSGGTEFFLSTLVCFAAGTRILTATGERTIETLLQGDIVLTLSNGELNAQPVKWLGRRRIDMTAHPDPERVAPVRIRRGAFADNMPHNDLLVSPDHAVFVDGKLICARQLVNGTTIQRELGWTSVEYFHVELDTHAILFAEGLTAESYLDTGNRGFFANSGEPLVLHPDLTDESDYPTRAAGSCEPFVTDEASVQPVWQRLSERAAALGQPVPAIATTTDPALHIVAAGRTIRPIYADDRLCIFPLPRNASSVRLVSRASAPSDARPWLDDPRRLGVPVTRIVLRNASEVREMPVDHPDLRDGWWAVERDGIVLRRWTDGAAMLPLPAMGGPTMLELHLGGAMTYATESDKDRQAA